MANYPYELEKGSKKVPCPNCGRKSFKRVVDTATGDRLPNTVGRCDHESSCGYSFTWNQYFADNPEARNKPTGHFRERQKSRIVKPGSSPITGEKREWQARFTRKKPDYLEKDLLLGTLGRYEENAFVQFLLDLFPYDPDDVWQAVRSYRIGTKNGFTVFPTISRIGKVCKGKLLKFNKAGNTLTYPDGGRAVSSLEYYLKKEGKLKRDFETDKDVYFGEHLLATNPDSPIAIVESEKSAVIGSICKRVFDNGFVWLACGSGSWLNAKRLKRLGRDRTIWLFPDADPKGFWFAKWQGIALDASKYGLIVRVSDLIKTRATADEKADGCDMADYLIRLQRQRNDPATREAFRILIEDRLSLLMIDGRLTLDDAEAEILATGFFENAIREALGGTSK